MELDSRKQQVLRAIITEYVRTAEPVGSERLAEAHAFDAKAATIRNEMAALANLGYLMQPHTSAGRIPSDKGYRFYVDRLMASETAKPRLPRPHFDEELDEVLRQTCRMLASLTRCAAVATPPQRESVTLQQIHLTPITAMRILLVVILSSGEVEHRILDLVQQVPAAALTRLSNIFNEQMAGQRPDAARAATVTVPPDVAPLAGVAAKVRDAIADMLRPNPDENAVMEGTTQVLREPEFQDMERREHLLHALEDRRALLESLRAMGDEVDVTIGTENPRPDMREFSFVATQYHVGMHMTGFIGVFGPTRMAYSRTVPTVRAMARLLGDILTRLSVE